MAITSIKVRGYSCFRDDWCGFDQLKLINVIIGRNNTGKSQLLELVKTLCITQRQRQRFAAPMLLGADLSEQELRPYFPASHSGGGMNGNHWADNGALYADTHIQWSQSDKTEILKSKARPRTYGGMQFDYEPMDGAINALTDALNATQYAYAGKTFRHLMADRDVRPEESSHELRLMANGQGATNIIRDHLIMAEKIAINRPIIQDELRQALNEIFGPDGEFSQISVQQHEPSPESNGQGPWEVFLAEERKGLIPLASSGSGLKTVLLVLLNLLVMPKISGNSASQYVFAFEELENNLHPSLLRRLLKFIDAFALNHECPIFLTTHSSATLDLFSRADHAQFIRVTHDGKSASTQTIDRYFDRAHVLGDLGAKASDILQANGIVWVEGPSDAVYINHWIEMFSDGSLIEGRDYACAFYGGALLARTVLADPTEPVDGLVNLIPLNRNVAMICDSDKTSKATALKPRVKKAKEAIDLIKGATIWITSGKEIETYLPGAVLAAVLKKPSAPDPGQYDLIFPSAKKSERGKSYMESKLGMPSVDKMALALSAREHMTLEDMKLRLDWESQMTILTNAIRKWNE